MALPVAVTMDKYEEIEEAIAAEFGKSTTTRKAIGDFMMNDDHAVNIKSNNVAKQNYSPNMISIKKMHQWVFEEKKDLSFIFVDYKEADDGIDILKKSELIPIQNISWDCLTIEAQGYGVIQMPKPLKVDKAQTKKDFYIGFQKEYDRFIEKERKKHEGFKKKFIKDIDSIK